MAEQVNSDSAFSNVRNQVYATLIANLIILSHGCTIGWFSPALIILRSKDSPLSSGPLTNEEASWIGSLSALGATCGTFVIGLLSVLYGSKKAMIFLAFPGIIFWLSVHFASTFYHMFIGRFISGMTGGGMATAVSLYVSEISNDNLRGRLGSITSFSRNLGVMFGFLAGAVVEYQYRPYIFIFIPIIYLIFLFTIPNTPQHYIEKREFQKIDNVSSGQRAEKAILYYKGCNGKSDQENVLVNVNAEFERLKTVIERKKSEKFKLKDFCNRPALRGILFSIAISWFYPMTGGLTFLNYSSTIFGQSGTVLGINVSSNILAFVQIFGSLVSMKMGDTFGRKTALSISMIGSAIGLFIFALYMYFRQNGFDVSNYTWLPVICISVIIFVSSFGIVALATTCAIENYPPKIRTSGMVIYSVFNNTLFFMVDKLFPILMEKIHLHGILLIFSINSLAGLIFIIFMQETRGNSLDTIDSPEMKSSIDKNGNQMRF